MIHVGFTGTQSGMTGAQQREVYLLLLDVLCATDLHHGDCINADDQADQIAQELDIRRHLHIPTNGTRRARCILREGLDVTYAPLPYLQRNRAIVDATEALIAAPKEMTETLRSGTWATIRYARRQGKPLFIVWPDGTIIEERTCPKENGSQDLPTSRLPFRVKKLRPEVTSFETASPSADCADKRAKETKANL